MNQAEKELYLRQYSILKNQGKPFFPYALAKDSIMAMIVLLVIIFLSLMFGAELQPKANPTTTTYVPRPDWYFFFLFELLRVMRNVPKFTPMATIGVPTICMILLFLLPFYDRSPERRITHRPVALAAGLFTIAAMAYLTYTGANTGSPNSVDLKPPASFTAAQKNTFAQGEMIVGQSGCLACHVIGSNGNDGPGPNLTHVASKVPQQQLASTLINPTPPMPSFAGLPKNKFNTLVAFLSQLQESRPAMTGTLEETQVRAMFDRIAGLYDRMNTVMTAGLHHRWRRRAADLAQVGPGGRALDVATGTGDLAIALAQRVGRDGEVVAIDFSRRMLELARAKANGLPIRFEAANALALPFGESEFDAATVGFGARNFSDLDRGLREMVRVVRPGGRVVVLEITTPRRAPLSTFFELWFDRAVPALGRAAGDAEAYSYLPRSVKRFPSAEELAEVMWRCGLDGIRYLLTAGGIIALHVGVRR